MGKSKLNVKHTLRDAQNITKKHKAYDTATSHDPSQPTTLFGRNWNHRER